MSDPGSPFVGLSAFSAATAAYFTGRDRFALTLAGSVLQSCVTVLFGQSGAGKSSVLGAALPDALRAITAPKRRMARERLRVPEGAGAPAPEPSGPSEARGQPFRLLAFNRWHPGFEAVMFRTAAEMLLLPATTPMHQALATWAKRERAPVVLVLDQFEEFFLYHPHPATSPLVTELARISAEQDCDLHVLISLREDSLAQLDKLRAVIPDILAVTVPLRPLDIRAAEEAIRKPVAVWAAQKGVAISVEDELVVRLIDQVAVRDPSRVQGEAAVLPLVELPLLQLALERIWRESARPEGFTLAARTLDRLGGAAGIVREHLESTLNTLKPAQRALVPKLFRFLVTAGGGKQAWRAADLARELEREAEAELQARADPDGRALLRASGTTQMRAAQSETEVVATLQALAAGQARILRTQPDPRGEAPLYELFHDALARPVQKIARDAMVAEAQARLAKERRRRLTQLVIAGSVAVLMAFMAAGAFWLWRDAAHQKVMAQSERDRAYQLRGQVSVTVARQANDRGDHMTAMLLLLEAITAGDGTAVSALASPAEMALLDAWWRNTERQALLGHQGAVKYAAFSPDGRYIVTAAEDHLAILWDLATDESRRLEGHIDTVWLAEFSPDGRHVVTASYDGTARVWDLQGDLAVPRVLGGHGGIVWHAAFSPDGRYVVTASNEGGARLWDLQGNTDAPRILSDHGGRAAHAAFSADGRLVATAGRDGVARVFRAGDDDAPTIELRGHGAHIDFVDFFPDSRRLVTASEDRRALVWDLDDPANPIVLDGHRHTVNAASVDPSMRLIATVSDDRTVRVYDLADRAGARDRRLLPALEREEHDAAVKRVRFGPTGERFVTVSDDGTARVWSVADLDAAPVLLPARHGVVWHAAFSTDGRSIVTANADGSARVWDLNNPGAASISLAYSRDPVAAAVLSADRRYLATLRRQQVDASSARDRARRPGGEARLEGWDLDSAVPVAEPHPRDARATAIVAVARAGSRIALTDRNGRLLMLDGTAGPGSQPSPVGDAIPVAAASYDPDGSRLASLHRDGRVTLWSPGVQGSQGPDSRRLAQVEGRPVGIAFSPDGRFIAAATQSTVTVFDVADSPETARRLPTDVPAISGISWSRGARYLATMHRDGTARVWDMEAASLPAPVLLRAMPDAAERVVLSDDGRLALVFGRGGAYLWDLRNRRRPTHAALPNWPPSVVTAGWTADGSHLFALNRTGTLHYWPVPPPDRLLRQARAARTRLLSDAEREEAGIDLAREAQEQPPDSRR